MWLPASSNSTNVLVAAMPEANAKPRTPASRSAIQLSHALRVGFRVRE
jgi:hypothetical protein